MHYSFNLKKKTHYYLFNHDFIFLILIWINIFKKKQGKHTTPKTLFLKNNDMNWSNPCASWNRLDGVHCEGQITLHGDAYGTVPRHNPPVQGGSSSYLPIPCMVYIYLHLMDFFYGKCREIYHTCIPWVVPVRSFRESVTVESFWKWSKFVCFFFFEVGGGLRMI